ncbi:MAG: hypothetical protein IJG15_07585 [Lachnospiraceae bacterium]|nr:hypothetical protein [Lachnospiraceae bacterium]
MKNRQLNRLAGRVIKKAVRRKGGRSSLKAGLVFAGFGAMIYMSNRLIPKMADDYAFSFIWDGKTNGNLAYGNHRYRRVRTVKDLAASQLSHYMTWCGRTIGETLNQLVLMKDDKRLYDCVNTGVILAQLSLCLFAGRGRISLKKVSPAMALMMTAGYWFGAPHLVATSLWTTGAANYSWPGLLQSAFLLPYGLHYHDDSFAIPRPVAALSGLLAGWSNEAGGGMALAMSAAAVLSQRLALRGGTKPGGPLPVFASANTLQGAAPASGMTGRGQDTGWMACGLAGAAIGYGLLMLAPGNFKRIRIEKEYSDILSAELSGSSIVAQEDLYTPAMFLHYLKHSFSAVLLRELPLEIPVALYLMQKDRSRESTAYILALEAAAYGVPGILMLSPQFPKRAAYPGILYRLTAAVKALDRLEASSWSPGPQWKRPLGLAAGAAGAGLLVNVAAQWFLHADVYQQTEEQIRIMRESNGKGTVRVPDIMLSPFWARLAGDRGLDEEIKKIIRFEEYEGDPYNTAAAAYYGVEALQVYVPEDHPYSRKDPEAIKDQILMPVRSFCKMLPFGRLSKKLFPFSSRCRIINSDDETAL